MANAEHLEILKSGVAKWNDWREGEPENLIIDLSNAQINSFNLVGAKLHRTNLSRATFIDSNLKDADLTGADLTGANLGGTDLTNANLILADMTGVDLHRAFLHGAKLIRAKLNLANLTNAYFNKANLNEADLTGANLTNACLIGADLTEAILNEACLYNASLIGAQLSGAIIKKALLSGANFNEANLTKVFLNGTNLTGANLNGANLTRANLEDADFTFCSFGYTIFGLTDLSNCIGLKTVEVGAPCTIDFQTLRTSKNIPKSFLQKIGLPELFIDYLPEFYMDALNFYPVFLSHSWENKDFARKLYEALIDKGVNVFFDEKKVKPGDDLYESLSKGIKHYDKMILVCSISSLKTSWWVDREIDRLLAKERELIKESGQHINLLIPIRVDDYVFEWEGAKKEELKRYLIGDFREWSDEEKFAHALRDLLHALNVERPEIKPVSRLK